MKQKILNLIFFVLVMSCYGCYQSKTLDSYQITHLTIAAPGPNNHSYSTAGALSQIFNKNKDQKKLVTFITGGDPDFETSNKIIEILIKNNVDIIEIGMPFSDPMADGPTIQLSSNRALNNNIDLDNIFQLVANAKNLKNNLPIVLMGYYNVILNYGFIY